MGFSKYHNIRNGQSKCPKCGATEIFLNEKNGLLKCSYCRYEFSADKLEEMATDISMLQGEVLGLGTQDIQENQDIVTLKCASCGAEVVIDTSEVTQARCHWCRNTLSINQQIPNGSIPDVVLPFKITKEEAQKEIAEFVKVREKYAEKKFKEEFTIDNIMGVYFPYMLVDINSHVLLEGKGEYETSSHTVGEAGNERTYYDANLYEVAREFDLTIQDLTIESNSEKLDKKSNNATNNIINSILPFDTENCVKWNANYLKGYSSEKRDININDLREIVKEQAKDIARYTANESLKQYDRGVCWNKEELTVKGIQWKSVYLPVWLYSYKQKHGKKAMTHYIVVNARTKEVIGSVPVHISKFLGIFCLIEILGVLLMFLTNNGLPAIVMFMVGIIYLVRISSTYRNFGARHHHESETKNNMFNLVKIDKFIKKEKNLSNSRIKGFNNKKVNGQNTNKNLR